jgi:hypothetical protein
VKRVDNTYFTAVDWDKIAPTIEYIQNSGVVVSDAVFSPPEAPPWEGTSEKYRCPFKWGVHVQHEGEGWLIKIVKPEPSGQEKYVCPLDVDGTSWTKDFVKSNPECFMVDAPSDDGEDYYGEDSPPWMSSPTASQKTKRLSENAFFKSIGLNVKRDLARDCADFYLLEMAVAQGNYFAIDRLARHEAQLAKELSTYLDIAVGGEVRHATHMSRATGLPLPEEMEAYWNVASKNEKSEKGRFECWQVWYRLRRRDWNGTSIWLLHAAELFVHEKWHQGSVGGKGWSDAARVVHDYLYGMGRDKRKMKARTFVDRCWTIQHNGGAIFDKAYRNSTMLDRLMKVLNRQEQEDYNYLKRVASPEIRQLWDDHKQNMRQEHDATWLGVQEV